MFFKKDEQMSLIKNDISEHIFFNSLRYSFLIIR
jgi:hypothetical protein